MGGDRDDIVAGALRGVVAAMAMTGMRRLTRGLGLVPEPPPEDVAEHAPFAARMIARVPPEHRGEAIEVGHWLYGAAGGALFGGLAPAHGRGRWVGPLYGLALWGFFETGLVPALGLDHGRTRGLVERVAVAADHVLYGAVVGGRADPRR